MISQIDQESKLSSEGENASTQLMQKWAILLHSRKYQCKYWKQQDIILIKRTTEYVLSLFWMSLC